jgi:hypothetical protein
VLGDVPKPDRCRCHEAGASDKGEAAKKRSWWS